MGKRQARSSLQDRTGWRGSRPVLDYGIAAMTTPSGRREHGVARALRVAPCFDPIGCGTLQKIGGLGNLNSPPESGNLDSGLIR